MPSNVHTKLQEKEQELARALKAVHLRQKEQDLKDRSSRLLKQAKIYGEKALEMEGGPPPKTPPARKTSSSKSAPPKEKLGAEED